MTMTTDHRVIMEAPEEPSAPRLRLVPTGPRRSMLDGGWWPRSADLVAELPGLVMAIDKIRGPVTQLLLNPEDWDGMPRRLRVADRVRRLGYFASQPRSLLTALCDNGDRVDLLIVAPGAEPGTADGAMLLAATTGNLVRAENILAHLSSLPPADGRGTGQPAWDDDGGEPARTAR